MLPETLTEAIEHRDTGQHTPASAPKPLRILKARRQNAAEPMPIVTDHLPIHIPRRRSSYAVRDVLFSSSPFLEESDKENRELSRPRQKEGSCWYPFSSIPSTSADFTQQRNQTVCVAPNQQLVVSSLIPDKIVLSSGKHTARRRGGHGNH